jgi:hypothetical protein
LAGSVSHAGSKVLAVTGVTREIAAQFFREEENIFDGITGPPTVPPKLLSFQRRRRSVDRRIGIHMLRKNEFAFSLSVRRNS